MEDPPDPTRIRIDTDAQTLTVEWTNGVCSVFPLQRLREACTCANCREHTVDHIDPPDETSSDPEKRWTDLQVEPAGSVGIRITWDDGHSAGIYRWDRLRSLQQPAPQTEG